MQYFGSVFWFRSKKFEYWKILFDIVNVTDEINLHISFQYCYSIFFIKNTKLNYNGFYTGFNICFCNKLKYYNYH